MGLCCCADTRPFVRMKSQLLVYILWNDGRCLDELCNYFLDGCDNQFMDCFFDLTCLLDRAQMVETFESSYIHKLSWQETLLTNLDK
jgi:hypothetical protein